MSSLPCDTCGRSNPAGARWCGDCGQPVEATGDGRPGRLVLVLAVGLGAALLAGGVVIALVSGSGVEDPAAPAVASATSDAPCDLDTPVPTCSRWERPAPSGPAVVVRGVLAVGVDGDVVAVDLETGDEVWRTAVSVPVEGFGAAPAQVAAGLLVVNDQLGGVTALDPLSGDVVWELDTGAVQPSDDLGPLVVRTATGFLRGIDPIAGGLVWERRLDQRVYPEARVLGDVVVARRPTGLQAVERDDGEPRWASNEPVTAVHGRAGDTIVVSIAAEGGVRPEGRISGIDAGTGAVRWSRARAAGQQVLVGDEAVFVQATSTPLERLDATTGGSEWVVGGVDLVTADVAPEVLARGLPVMADRWFQLLDPATGDRVKESRVGRAGVTQVLATADGEIVVTTPDGLHRLPADGPARPELDAIRSTVVAATPLLVDVGGRLVRVVDEAEPDVPDCVVGLRRTACPGWSVPADGTAAVVADDVVVSVLAGSLQGIAVDSGDLLWRVRVADDPGAQPVLAAGRSVVVAGERVHALDPRTGEVRWSAEGRLVDAEDRPVDVVPVRRGDRLVLLDPIDGAVTTTVTLGEDTEELEVVGITDDAVVVRRHGEAVDEIRVLALATGEELLTRKLAAQQVHVGGGALWLGPHDDGGVYRNDLDTGALVWGRPVGELVWTTTSSGPDPTGRLLVQEQGADDAEVYALDPGIGATLWSRSSAPVVAWGPAGSFRTVIATTEGIDVVDARGETVWRFDRPGVELISPDPLLVLDDGDLVRLDDPTGS